MSPMRDGTTSKDRATQHLICEPLSFAMMISIMRIVNIMRMETMMSMMMSMLVMLMLMLMLTSMMLLMNMMNTMSMLMVMRFTLKHSAASHSEQSQSYLQAPRSCDPY